MARNEGRIPSRPRRPRSRPATQAGASRSRNQITQKQKTPRQAASSGRRRGCLAGGSSPDRRTAESEAAGGILEHSTRVDADPGLLPDDLVGRLGGFRLGIRHHSGHESFSGGPVHHTESCGVASTIRPNPRLVPFESGISPIFAGRHVGFRNGIEDPSGFRTASDDGSDRFLSYNR